MENGMVLYRNVAEWIIEEYDFEWNDNLRMKEACICSVENVIANVINMGMLVTLALITGFRSEIFIYFFTFAAMRTYAGGGHAKNHLRCILTYICIMISAIICAKCLVSVIGKNLLIICVLALVLAGWVNMKYGSRQRELGERKAAYRKKLLLIYLIITVFMLIIMAGYLQSRSVFLGEMLMIQSFALMAESISLYTIRKECIH